MANRQMVDNVETNPLTETSAGLGWA
jgi:hypothetical protein